MALPHPTSRWATWALLGALASALLLGCGDDVGSDGSDGPAVVGAFYPLAFAAERVAGGEASVENLTQPGGEPHDLELGINQTVALQDADRRGLRVRLPAGGRRRRGRRSVPSR